MLYRLYRYVFCQPKGLNITDTFILPWGKRAESTLTQTPIIFIKKDWRGDAARCGIMEEERIGY